MARDLIKIYVFKFFDDFVLIYPFYTLMFADFGITPVQIGILLGVWSFTSFALEVPSGVIADKYSRKHILFFAQLTRAVGYAVWLLFPTFEGFLIGFILWGVKSAFTSGTYQALIYDLLKEHTREQDYARVTGRAKTLSYIGTLAASGGAALAINMGYPLVLVLSIVALVISALSIISVTPAHTSRSTHEKEFYALLKSGFKFLLKENFVLRLVIFVAVVHALGGAIDEYFPIFGSLATVQKSVIAVFIGAMSAAEAVASFYAYKFEHLSTRFFYTILALSGLLFYVAAAQLNLNGLVLLVIFSGLYVISSVVIESKIQHLIPSETRATVSSMQGFMVELGVLAVYFGFGLLAQSLNYARAFQIFGLIIIVFGVTYLLASFFWKKAEEKILEENYKLPAIDLSPWKRGYVGETYVLKSQNQKYFVKVVDKPMSSGNMGKALPVLKELHEQGVNSINYPIQTNDNKLGVIFGMKFLTVYNFIEGTNDFNYDFEKYSELLALIHAKTPSIVNKPGIEDFSLPFLETFIAETRTLTESKFSNSYQNKLQEVFNDNQSWFMPKLQKLVNLSSSLSKKHFELVITHGDAPGNVIHNSKGDVFLIDWDDLLLAPRERDTWFHVSNKSEAAKFLNYYKRAFPNYEPDQELVDFYILRRFFDDFQGPTSKILSADTSEKEKEMNFKLLVEDCLGWLKPLLSQIGDKN